MNWNNQIRINDHLTLQTHPLSLYVKGSRATDVQPKVLRLLALLASKPNELVSHDTIIQHLWGGNYVTGKQGIIRTVNKLRKLLDESPEEPSIIVSYYGEGYSFVSFEHNYEPLAVDPLDGQQHYST